MTDKYVKIVSITALITAMFIFIIIVNAEDTSNNSINVLDKVSPNIVSDASPTVSDTSNINVDQINSGRADKINDNSNVINESELTNNINGVQEESSSNSTINVNSVVNSDNSTNDTSNTGSNKLVQSNLNTLGIENNRNNRNNIQLDNSTQNNNTSDTNLTTDNSSLLVNNLNYSIINITIVNSPTSLTFNESTLKFGFIVNYSTNSNVNCNFSIINSSNFYYYKGNGGISNFSNFSVNINESGNYSWNFMCNDILNSSINTSINDNFYLFFPYYSYVNLSSDKNSIIAGQILLFNINASLSQNSPMNYIIDYNDGLQNAGSTNSQKLSAQFIHNFTTAGRYNVQLNVSNGSKSLTSTIVINVNLSTSVANIDNQDPQITLVEPSYNSILNDSYVEFNYYAYDNVKIANCSFDLFYYNNSGSVATDVYHLISRPANNQNIDLNITGLNEGDYTWSVECFDNSSNSMSDNSDFKYNLTYWYSLQNTPLNVSISIVNNSDSYVNSNDPNIMKVNGLISAINDFLVLEESYSKDQQDAVNTLNIIENLRLYKKQLLQFQTDLGQNIAYIKDSTLKQQRIDDINKAILNMSQTIPQDIQVVNVQQFTKNSFSSDMKNVITQYNKANNIFMSNGELNSFISNVRDLQNNVGVSTGVKYLDITYYDNSTSNITLIERTISIKNNSAIDGIIEILPKTLLSSYNKTSIINKNDMIQDDPIFYVDKSDLINSEIIYTFDGFGDIDQIKNSDTIGFSLLSSSSKQASGITGYSILFFSGQTSLWFYLSWIVFILVVISIVYSLYKSRKIAKLKKKPDFIEIAKNVKGAYIFIKDEDLAKAKECYARLKVIYSRADEEVKKFVYKKIVELQLNIDKKEIGALIKECIIAFKEGRNNDAKLLYSNIRPIYNRLPKDLKKKVYEKIIPYLGRE